MRLAQLIKQEKKADKGSSIAQLPADHKMVNPDEVSSVLSAKGIIKPQRLDNKAVRTYREGAQGLSWDEVRHIILRRCPWALLMLICAVPACNAQVGHARVDDQGGFYFYQKPPKPVVKRIQAPVVNPVVGAHSKKAHQLNCSNPKEWSPEHCGFVVPMSLNNWSDRYEFEQKEYKRLLPYSIFSKTDTGAISGKAVYEWQKFQNWILDWSMQYSYVWDYERLQHPDVNAVAQAPDSQFGNNLIRNINAANESAYLKNLSKTAMLVFFTRHGDKGTPQYCPQCQAMAPVVLDLSKSTHIPLYEASLDKKHFRGFNYHLWPETKAPAQILKVSIVPTVFLYLKPNAQGKGAQWIRVAINAEAEDTIKRRIVNFAQGFRDAIIAGYQSASKKAPENPDFRHEYNNWLAIRGTSADANNQGGASE